MRCSQAKDLISFNLDEKLEEYDRARLVEHLESCADCEGHQDVLMRSRDLLQAGLQEPSENFEWKVQLAIQRELRSGARRSVPERSRGRFWLPAGLTTGLVAASVIAMGWFLLPTGDGAPMRDLSGGQAPNFIVDGQSYRDPVQPVGGALPGRNSMPFQFEPVNTSRLLQERENLRGEVLRLQMENRLLRQALEQSKLTPRQPGENSNPLSVGCGSRCAAGFPTFQVS